MGRGNTGATGGRNVSVGISYRATGGFWAGGDMFTRVVDRCLLVLQASCVVALCLWLLWSALADKWIDLSRCRYGGCWEMGFGLLRFGNDFAGVSKGYRVRVPLVCGEAASVDCCADDLGGWTEGRVRRVWPTDAYWLDGLDGWMGEDIMICGEEAMPTFALNGDGAGGGESGESPLMGALEG